MRKRVTLVEDDVVIRDNYADILVEVGFEVDVCGNRHDAMAHFCEVSPDIALLDIGLEEERDGGFQLCSDLRQLSPTLPIIFLASRSEDVDRISGLRLGATTFASGWKIVYKPRPLSLDEHFQEFLTWLNQRDGSPDFRLLNVWNRGEYGWVEYVKHAGCSSQFEVEQFYKRQGGYLALPYALGATDFHF